MKKILSVFLVLTMIVVLVACNANTDKETTSADTTVETTEKAGTTETTVETTTADTTETTTEETTTAEETTTNKDPETQKTSIKILAIGNSFSEDSMEYLYGILQDLGYKEIVLGNMYTGGCSLATHAKNIEHKEKGYYSTYHENTNGKWTHDSNSPTLVKTINKYDVYGNLTESNTYDADSKLMWKTIITYSNGQKTDSSEYDKNGLLRAKTIYQYTDGKLADETGYDSDGALIWKIVYKYNATGKVQDIFEYIL